MNSNTPTTAAGNAERARFEAAMTAQGWTISRDADTGLYFKNEVQDRWEGWQAALSPGNQPAGATKAPQGLREAVVEEARQSLNQARQKYQDGFDNVPFCELASAMDKLLAALAPYVTAQPAPSPAREDAVRDADAAFLDFPDDDPQVLVYKQRVWQLARRIARDLTTARQQRDNLHVLHNKSARYSEELRDLCADLRAQLADARAEAKQWNDLHTAADYEVGALRTLASELAAALDQASDAFNRMAHGDEELTHGEAVSLLDLTRAARDKFRSSTPAPCFTAEQYWRDKAKELLLQELGHYENRQEIPGMNTIPATPAPAKNNVTP